VSTTVLGATHGITKSSMRLLARWEAQAPEKLAVELPVVREIFSLFDADVDGCLSKEEYRRFVQGIGEWGPSVTEFVLCTNETREMWVERAMQRPRVHKRGGHHARGLRDDTLWQTSLRRSAGGSQ
jgi:hypothetical protein